ncbi:MAG: crossover junction endodeoxyribonuclease RuvC [Ichthyobacteriaceae bacterium]|nr:crossover junction endodeoxyribonuclease RuvC [Ichthyobacteriaceae bacterium]
MGFGLIKVTGKKLELITHDVLILNKIDDHYLKLKRIFEKTTSLIDNYHPDEIAIEAPFFGKNVQSMLKLGRAQGVAIAAGMQREVAITEYSPKKIKLSITGSGNSSKEQVALMLMRMLKMTEMPKYLDATDGLAAAVCHYLNNGENGNSGKSKQTKSYSGWGSFIKNNPERVK